MVEAVTVIMILGGFGCVVVSIVYFSIANGISPMPSTPKTVRAMIALLNEGEIGGQILELGSGWGHVAVALAMAFPSAKVVAIENSWIPFWVSWLLSGAGLRKNLSFQRADFYQFPLVEADVLVCYLFPGAMDRLQDKILRECKDGCIIVSNTFAMPGWTAMRQIRLGGLWNTHLYVYRVGENRTE